jgi:hypothetical protein
VHFSLASLLAPRIFAGSCGLLRPSLLKQVQRPKAGAGLIWIKGTERKLSRDPSRSNFSMPTEVSSGKSRRPPPLRMSAMPVLLIKIKTAFNWETMASAALHRRQLLKVLAGAAARPCVLRSASPRKAIRATSSERRRAPPNPMRNNAWSLAA